MDEYGIQSQNSPSRMSLLSRKEHKKGKVEIISDGRAQDHFSKWEVKEES